MSRPRLTPGGYWDGPPIDREASDLARAESDALGSRLLCGRISRLIVRHANDNGTSVAQAMNELLYAGELR